MNEKILNIINLLKKNNATITTVESCTGGRLAAQITAVPGASNVFPGAVVTYQTWVKEKLIGVKHNTIQEHDVVSEEVAVEMVKGGCKLMNSQFAVAVTGYAGPDGGTDNIPVGTIWIACGSKNKTYTKCLNLGNDRIHNLNVATETAIDMLCEFVYDALN